MNAIASQPLSRRIAAHPIAARLARLGLPSTLREASASTDLDAGLALALSVEPRVAA